MTPAQAGLAIDALPRIVRRCADLVHIEGMVPAEISRKLALPLSVVIEHLETDRAARQMLADALTERASTWHPTPDGMLEAQAARIVSLADEGLCPRDIARRVRKSLDHVLRALESNGVTT